MEKPFKKAGKLIRLARKKKGLRQGELAQELGTIESHISKWETGQHKPSDTYLRKICEALGLDYERMDEIYVGLYYATQAEDSSSVPYAAEGDILLPPQNKDTLIAMLRSAANTLEHMKLDEEGKSHVYQSLIKELQSRL